MEGWYASAKMRHGMPRRAKPGPTQKFTSATSPQKFRASSLEIPQYSTSLFIANELITAFGEILLTGFLNQSNTNEKW